ncbi:MAG: hypothetical protein H6Q31_1654 [Bacteroidetes bacterium]|nr:hypothetical protein [Bacteroidota bacterium]
MGDAGAGAPTESDAERAEIMLGPVWRVRGIPALLLETVLEDGKQLTLGKELNDYRMKSFRGMQLTGLPT